MLLVEQLIHQRCVQPGPLVLGTNPRKFPIVHSGYKPNCLTRDTSRRSSLEILSTITDGTDYTFILLFSVRVRSRRLISFTAHLICQLRQNQSLRGQKSYL